MIRNIPQFLIAAPTSGTGKTTVSRLLMTLLTQKKLRVQPYKCGPDYIDTKYHEKACGIRLTIWILLWLPNNICMKCMFHMPKMRMSVS